MLQNGKRADEYTSAPRPAPPRVADPGPLTLQRLQGAIGNAAVARLVGQGHPVVQRARVKDPAGPWYAHPTAGREDGTVLSGHGAHEESGGAGSITVPEGTTVHFYVPHGSMLSDMDGGKVERGELNPPASAQGENRDVTLVSSGPSTPGGPSGSGAPHGITKTYGPGDSMPDYTLYHPKNLHIHGNPIQLRSRSGPYDLRGTYVVGRRSEGPAIVSELGELGLIAPGRTVTFEEAVRLSALLKPNMGKVHFAACRSVR